MNTPAPCRDEDPDLFFPDATEHKKFSQAQAVCDGCSIRAACFADATERGEENGVWGGMKFGQPMSATKSQIELDADGYPIGFDRSKLRKTECGRGHKFTPENSRWSIHHGKIARACKKCVAITRTRSPKNSRRPAELAA